MKNNRIRTSQLKRQMNTVKINNTIAKLNRLLSSKKTTTQNQVNPTDRKVNKK